MAKDSQKHEAQRFTAREIASVERDNKVQAAEMREHNERLDAADRERIRLLEAAQKDHNDKAMFRITVASTVVAVAAAFGAIWSGFEAHKTRIDDERPFVGVDVTGDIPRSVNFDWANPTSDSRFPVTVTISSSGKSAAQDVTVDCSIQLPDYYAKWDSNNLRNDTNEFIYLLPGRSTDAVCRYTNNIPKSHPPDPSLRTGPDSVYVLFGVARYTDESDTAYQTPFCYLLGKAPIGVITSPCQEAYGLPKLK